MVTSRTTQSKEAQSRQLITAFALFVLVSFPKILLARGGGGGSGGGGGGGGAS